MKLFLCAAFFFFAVTCSGQPGLNFKPYTINNNLALANEDEAKQLLEISIKKFLLIANDTTSKLNYKIQSSFAELRAQDHLHSYIYPKKLSKECISTQFIDWTALNGLDGAPDRAWNTEIFTTLIFVPLMIEEPKGNSVLHLCFKTELEIIHNDNPGKIMHGKDKPEINYKIDEIDLTSLTGKSIH